MALRGFTSAWTTTSATSASITYAGAQNIQVGDLIILDTVYRTGGFHPVTDPSGFTPGANLTPPLADENLGTANHHIAVKIANSADAGTPTYTQSGSYTGSWSQQLRVYYGRVNTSVAAAFSNTAATAVGASGSTPYTYDITGVTALAGDDIVVLTGSPFLTAYALSAAISGYGNLSVAQYVSGSKAFIGGLDRVNAPAGATGTLVESITAPSTVNGLEPGAFVLSLPAANSVRPGGFFFGANRAVVPGMGAGMGAATVPATAVAMFMPLSWVIGRRNKLAAERQARGATPSRARWTRDAKSGLVVPER